MKYLTSLSIILLLLPCIFSCTRPKQTKIYDFSYSGSLYTGDTVVFSTTAGPTNTVKWYFGNLVYNDGYTIENFACDTCKVSGSLPLDTSTATICKHVYYTPGTYNVSFTLNNDPSTKVTKSLTVLSPEALGASKLMMSRHWVRTRREFDCTPFDSTYSLPDTTFALTLAPNSVGTPHKLFPFKPLKSSSSVLVYERKNDPHYFYDGNVTYNIRTDSIFVTETFGTICDYITTTYKSGN